MRVILYSKPDCSLCDELKLELLEFLHELGFELIERNILESDADFERYRFLIPILEIEGGELLHPPHHWDAVRSALYSAHRQTA
jgi:hypothetical protein